MKHRVYRSAPAWIRDPDKVKTYFSTLRSTKSSQQAATAIDVNVSTSISGMRRTRKDKEAWERLSIADQRLITAVLDTYTRLVKGTLPAPSPATDEQATAVENVVASFLGRAAAVADA